MSTPINSIRNLGPATAAGFARAGIGSAEELRDLGPDRAYRKWLDAGEPPHFLGYAALVLGLQGRPWNDARGAEKEALKARFDALKREALVAQDGVEAILDQIGIRAKGIRAKS